MLLGSVSVCKAPISIFTSLSFKERKVTGLSYVELSSLLNFPSRTTWRKNTFISVSTRDHASMVLVSKVNIHSTRCYWQLVIQSYCYRLAIRVSVLNRTPDTTHKSSKSHSKPTRKTKMEMQNKTVSILPQTLWFQNDEGEATETARC